MLRTLFAGIMGAAAIAAPAHETTPLKTFAAKQCATLGKPR